MKITFVSGNREQLPDPVIPLGLLYVMASTPDHHHKSLVDLCFESEPDVLLKSRLAEDAPDVVALGMRNIQNADYSGTADTLDYYAGLVETIRASTDAPIVIGGAGFSVMPRELMERLRPDYGISGEGELAFAALLDALETRAPVDGVGNLHWFDETGTLHSTAPPRGFLDMNALPPPDRSLLNADYYSGAGIDSLQTKRGCPLRCDYCTYPIIEGRVGRTREPKRVVDELETLLGDHPDTRHFFIVDSVFNLPTRHAKAVCEEMIERRLETPWTCYANPLGFDEELAGLAARAGCAGMEVGSDSGSDAVLERLRKGFTTAQIRRFHQLAQDAGIPDCHTFILGTPGETLDDVFHTLDFIVDLDPFSVILMVWTDDAEALDPGLRAERQRLRDSILQILDDRKQAFPWWSIPAIGVNYDARLFDLLRRRGFHGPLWQHVRDLLPPPPPDQSPKRKNGLVATS